MSRLNTHEGKRLRRIARRTHKETSLKEFNLKLHKAFVKKYPKGRPFLTDEGRVFVTAKRPPRSPVIVRSQDVRRHVYLREHNLPHSERVAALGTVIAA